MVKKLLAKREVQAWFYGIPTHDQKVIEFQRFYESKN